MKRSLFSRRPLSLQTKLTAVITLPMVGIVAAVLGLLGMLQFDQTKEAALDHAESIRQAVNQDLERLYFTQDQRLCADLVDQLHSFPDLRRVCAFDKEGNVFFSHFAAGVPHTAPVFAPREKAGDSDSPVALWRPLTSGQHELGQVYLELSGDRLRDEVRKSAVTIGAISATVLLLGSLLGSVLQRIISRPILDLQKAAESISKNEDFSVRAVRRTDDEIGQLVDAFNAMLSRIQTSGEALREANHELERRVTERTAELAQTVCRVEHEIEEHKKTQAEREALYRDLMTASRQAGMADVATGILHNVGNVLNSVNVSAHLLIDKLQDTQAAALRKACELIDENTDRLAEFFTQDEKGRRVVAFLKLLATKMSDDRDDALREVRSLADNIEHIKEIVSLQQSLTRVYAIREPVSLAELAENALKINNAGLHRHGVHVVREYQEVPEIVTEKHKVLQILVNFISNAKYATSAADREDRRMSLRIYRRGEDKIGFDVADNGVGIAPEHLTKIFTHGFTTKKDGHGFGLHSSALAAQEMGGRILVASEGPGRGATFTLELPLDFTGERTWSNESPDALDQDESLAIAAL